MKKIYIYLSVVSIVMLASCTITNYPQSYTSDQQDITYQQFYDDLSPYGQWVNYRNYGYVWVPDEMGFRPYYNNGHWVYTDFGWTWVSDYSWAGLRFTMDAGRMIMLTAGCGYRATNGHRHGFHGEVVVITMDGHPLARTLILMTTMAQTFHMII